MSDPRCECGHRAAQHPYLTETFPDACSECSCERFTPWLLQEGDACPVVGRLQAGPESDGDMMSAVQFQMRICESALCRGEHVPCSRCEVLVEHEARLRAEIERLRREIDELTGEATPAPSP